MKSKLEALPPVDPARRYTRAQACAYLQISLPTLYGYMTDGSLATIKDGKRRFVPGASIIAKSTVTA